MLAGPHPHAALKKLAFSLVNRSAGKLPVEVLDRMVDAYRASRAWRSLTTLPIFIDTMLELAGGNAISDGCLQTVLGVWSWRYGEATAKGSQPPRLDEAFLSMIAHHFVQGLGGREATEPQIRQLIGTLSKEPDGIPRGDGEDPGLRDHAQMAADGLIQVMRSTSPAPRPATAQQQWPLDAIHVRRTVGDFLHQPSSDSRWQSLVISSLRDQALMTVRHGWISTELQWNWLLLDACKAYLAEIHPKTPPPDSIDAAIRVLREAGKCPSHSVDVGVCPAS